MLNAVKLKIIIKNHLLTYATALYCSNAFCGEVLPGAYEIVAVLPGPVGLNIQLSPNPAQCTSQWWGTQAVIKKETTNYNTLTANVMSAFMADKQISAIHYNVIGDGTCKNGNELSVYAFKVSK